MKKILISAAFLSIAALVSTKAWAMAEPPGAATGEATSDGADESAPDAADDELAPDVAARCHHHRHAAFNGPYLGAGVHIANVGAKSEYLGGAPSGFKHDLQSNDSKTRLGGTFALGYGQRIPESPAHLGFEVGFDIAPNTDNTHMSKTEQSIMGGAVVGEARLYDLETSCGGFVPYFAIIMGMYYCGRLFYLKPGASYAKSTEKYTGMGIINNVLAPNQGAYHIISSCEHNFSTITPLVALGMRKPCGKEISYCIEIEYKFGKSKEKDIDNIPAPIGILVVPQIAGSRLKLTQKGAITLRIFFYLNL